MKIMQFNPGNFFMQLKFNTNAIWRVYFLSKFALIAT